MNNNLYSKIYGWLFLGLLVSFTTGYALSYYPNIVINIMSSAWFLIIILLELGIAIFFTSRIQKMSKITAIICYFIYCIITGFTFSTIFLAYKITSILIIFFVTAILFGIFALIGYITKKDLTKLGGYLLITLFGIIIVSLINLFLNNTMTDLIISIVGIIVFVLFIAYDINKIKLLVNQLGTETGPIYCAFQLYLDFINLFLRILRIFGKNRD